MKTFFVIMIEGKPKYICDCSKIQAQLRVENLRQEYNQKYKVKSSWVNAVKIELVEVQGDASSDSVPLQVLKYDNIIEGEII